MRYQVVHKTHYSYNESVSVSQHLARITPRQLPNQRCLQHSIQVEPHATLSPPRLDYFGNSVTFISVEGTHAQLSITANSIVEINPAHLPNPLESAPWESVRDECTGDRLTPAIEAGEFAFDSPLVPRKKPFADYAKSASFHPGQPILSAALDLTSRIHKDFAFDPKATALTTPLEQVFRERRGVCQDFAHFHVACMRSLGLPARYVSGYLETIPPPGKPKLVGADASHAWVSVYCPPYGWIDLDPTNNLHPSDRHIVTAWGRDYSDVSPICGVLLGSGSQHLSVAVDVTPLPPPPSSSSSSYSSS